MAIHGRTKQDGYRSEAINWARVITSYSIHYTKLYDWAGGLGRVAREWVLWSFDNYRPIAFKLSAHYLDGLALSY